MFLPVTLVNIDASGKFTLYILWIYTTLIFNTLGVPGIPAIFCSLPNHPKLSDLE